jgi:serine/threonine protein kinase
LIESLLQYEPKNRIPAIEALAHPYFDELRDFETRMPDGSRISDIFHLTDEEIRSANYYTLEKIIP